MGIYLLIFALLCPFTLVELTKHKIKPKLFADIALLCIFLLLFYISGFRYGLETDYWTYYKEFYGDSGRTLEITFSIIMNTIKRISNNYNLFLIVFALISIGLKYRLFSKMEYCFSVLLIYYVRFFVQFDLNAIRQGLAIVFVMYAFPCLKKGQTKKYILYILLAITIHTSAAVLLVLPLAKNIKLTWIRVLGWLAFAIVFRLVLLDRCIGVFSRFLPAIFSSSNKLINSLQYILNNNTENAFDLLPYVRIIVPTIALYSLTKSSSNEFYFRAYLIGSFINLAFFGLDTVSFRLAAYFFSAEILMLGDLYKSAIPNSISQGKVGWKSIKALLCLMVVMFCDMWTFFSLLGSSKSLVPFRNFITK